MLTINVNNIKCALKFVFFNNTKKNQELSEQDFHGEKKIKPKKCDYNTKVRKMDQNIFTYHEQI